MFKRKKSISKEHVGLYFVMPFFIIFLIFGLFPILYTFYLMFFNFDQLGRMTEYVGLYNLTKALQDPKVWTTMFTAFKLWGATYFLELSSALILAAIFTYSKLKGKHFYKSAFYVPNLVSSAAAATLFSLFMGFPQGLINQIMLNQGWILEPINFKASVVVIPIVVVVIGWWMWFGRTSIVASAGMTSISNDIYEAAKVDGANFWQTFTKITIPLIKPILLFMIITSMIGGIQAFDIPYLLVGSTAGGPNNVVQTISMYIFQVGIQGGNYGYASAVSVILFVVIASASLAINYAMNRKEFKNATK